MFHSKRATVHCCWLRVPSFRFPYTQPSYLIVDYFRLDEWTTCLHIPHIGVSGRNELLSQKTHPVAENCHYIRIKQLANSHWEIPHSSADDKSHSSSQVNISHALDTEIVKPYVRDISPRTLQIDRSIRFDVGVCICVSIRNAIV